MPLGSQSTDVTVGIDIGTSGVKALAVDQSGEVLARAELPSDLRLGPNGRMEHDAASTWADSVRRVWGQVCAMSSRPPAAVAVSAMSPSVVAVDGDGSPLSAGLLYGDQRADAPEGGTVDPLANSAMARLCGWLATSPAAPRTMAYWPAQALANSTLCGQAVIDLATAFACGPLFGGSDWDERACNDAGIGPSQLPGVVMFGQAVGEVPSADGAAGASPLLVAGSVDGMCDQMVAGAVKEGDVLIVLGSTLLVWVVTPGWPDLVDGLWKVPSLVGGYAMVGGASNAGGLWAQWAHRLTGRRPGPLAPLAADDVPIWWPWVNGERVPWHNRALSVGLSEGGLSHGPDAALRAAYEASAFVVRHIVGLAEASGARARRFILAGGGARDREWTQALADALGRDVLPAQVPEGAALGAAFLARMGLGHEANLEDAARWARWQAPVEPRPDWVGPTEQRYQRWCLGLPR